MEIGGVNQQVSYLSFSLKENLDSVLKIYDNYFVCFIGVSLDSPSVQSLLESQTLITEVEESGGFLMK